MIFKLICYTNNVNSPQVEAANLLKSVLDDYFNGSQDISSFLRRCQHACEIMNWQDQKSWFKMN